jgi:HPt (histidine-containing phosphotransfer) domain-containing protein
MKDINILKDAQIDVNKGIEILGDIEMYDDTINDFIDEIDDKKANLMQYHEANDLTNYAIFAHSIKSDSKYLGFTDLANIAYQHELAGKDNNIDQINETYSKFLTEIDRITNVCKKYIGSRVE